MVGTDDQWKRPQSPPLYQFRHYCLFVYCIRPERERSDPPPTLVLFLLAAATLIVRHRGRKGRLVQVLLRDGGIYCAALTGELVPFICVVTIHQVSTFIAIRFGTAILNTPAIVPVSIRA